MIAAIFVAWAVGALWLNDRAWTPRRPRLPRARAMGTLADYPVRTPLLPDRASREA